MKLFVFDLDYTLWNAGDTWVDCTHPPFVWRGDRLKDQSGRWLRLYPDVKSVLEELKDAGKLIAAASRTDAPPLAGELMRLLEIDHFFDAREIYPGSKITHLSKIEKALGVAREDTVFFDDEYRNIDDISSIGIRSVFVRDGLTRNLVEPFL